jgi:hypothetical protein
MLTGFRFFAHRRFSRTCAGPLRMISRCTAATCASMSCSLPTTAPAAATE